MIHKNNKRQRLGAPTSGPTYTRLVFITTTALCLPMMALPTWAGNYTGSVSGGTHGVVEVLNGESNIFNAGDTIHNTTTKPGNAIFINGAGSTLNASGTAITLDATATSDSDLSAGVRAHGGTVNLIGGAIEATGAAYTRGILAIKTTTPTTVTTNDTNISTIGKESDAVHAYRGGEIAINGGNIATNGNISHGLYSEKVFKADGAAANITAKNTNIITKGSNSWGAFAEEGGLIDLAGSRITTTGNNGNGVVAGLDSHITVTDSTIDTSGKYAYGYYANPLVNSEATESPSESGSSITAINSVVTTKGDWAFGAFSKNGGHIELTDGAINTSGERAYGILAGDNSSVSSSANIKTTGNKAHGVQAGDDGGRDSQVELKGGKIQTSGSDAYGLHSLGGNISGFAEIITEGANGFGAFAESDSSIDLHDSAITTSGTTAHGLLANNDAGTDGGRITTNKVAIKTLGDGSVGAFASGGGSLDLTDTTIRTEGLRGYGAYATADSSITLKGGAIITANETGRGTQNGDGSRAYALYAEGDGANISADDLSIKTLGQRAYGAYAIGGGDITLANTNVTTEGFMAYGLYASGVGSTLTASNTNVTTTGQAGDAVWAYNNGVVNLNGGTFHVLGEQNPKTPNETANGLVAVGSGSILATDITLVTEGANSAGLLVGGDVGADKTAGTINLKNSSVTVKGADAFGAIVSYGSSLNLEGSQLISNKGAGIQLNDNASVNLNGSRIVAAKETFVSNLSNTFILPIGRIPASPVSQTINVGAGSVATQNNGTLLRVNREDGAGGDVTLNLGAGSVTSGDILDTDDHNIGGTDVTLEAGAFWTGIMQGVRNFFSEQKSDVVFQDRAVIVGDLGGKGSTYSFSQAGGSIGGNVDLSGGSSTTGGSIGTPVIVAGDVAIDQTSLFGGNWDIDGDVTNSGTIRPGNSVGVINIGGDLTLAPTSVYAVEVDANGSSDRVNVTGIARLDGSVAVSSLGTPLLGTPYTVLTAGGGFAGTQFDSVALSNNYAFITPALSYDANQVLLSIDRNNVTYASVAQTKNQAATAAALDQLPLSSAVANTLAFTTTAQARGAFNQLSGEIHASAKSALIEDSRPVRDAVDNRIRATFEQPADSAKGLWIQAYGARSDIDGNSNVADLHHSTGGVLIGADGFVTETVHVGLVTGYGHSSFDANDRDSSGSSDNYHFGLYGGSEWGNLAFRSGVIYTWHDIETRRSVGFGGLSDRLKGDYDGRSLQAFGELGYKVETAGATYEPFANLTHVNLKTDGFTEKGGATALSASDQTTDTTFTTLGLRADTRLALGNVNAKLRGKLGWQHAFNDRTPVSNNSFVGGNGFNVDGTEIGKDTAIIETGIDLELTSNTALGVSYMGQIGSGTTQQGVNANISVKF